MKTFCFLNVSFLGSTRLQAQASERSILGVKQSSLQASAAKWLLPIAPPVADDRSSSSLSPKTVLVHQIRQVKMNAVTGLENIHLCHQIVVRK